MNESGRENVLNVKRENWKRGAWGSRGENQEEKGLAAGDRVLSRHLAEANRDEEEKRIWGAAVEEEIVEMK